MHTPFLELSSPHLPTGSSHTCAHLCGICGVVAAVLLVFGALILTVRACGREDGG
jgi:hypothetical protein